MTMGFLSLLGRFNCRRACPERRRASQPVSEAKSDASLQAAKDIEISRASRNYGHIPARTRIAAKKVLDAGLQVKAHIAPVVQTIGIRITDSSQRACSRTCWQ